MSFRDIEIVVELQEMTLKETRTMCPTKMAKLIKYSKN
jgi:hypothetical protein